MVRRNRSVPGPESAVRWFFSSRRRRPALVARMLQDGATLEVVRLATDGTKDARSLLYGAAWRASRELGYQRLVTDTPA